MARINAARVRIGLTPLLSGANGAAQSHADDMCRNAFQSYWGSDGSTPTIRYSLHGGTQYSRQLALGPIHRSRKGGELGPRDLRAKWDSTIDGILEPTTGRSTALNPRWSNISVGVATYGADQWAVLLFETDQLELKVVPNIKDGILLFEARAVNGGQFSGGSHLARVSYSPLPHHLTRSQLVLSSGSEAGRPIMSVMKPDADGRRYKEGGYITEQSVGVNPYDIHPEHILPESPSEALSMARELAAIASETKETWKVARRNAEVRLSDDGQLSASVWFGSALDRFGDGVYTVTIWGTNDSDAIVPLSEHAIFVPPRSIGA